MYLYILYPSQIHPKHALRRYTVEDIVTYLDLGYQDNIR